MGSDTENTTISDVASQKEAHPKKLAVIKWNWEDTDQCKTQAATAINDGHLLHLQFHVDSDDSFQPKLFNHLFAQHIDSVGFFEFTSQGSLTSDAILKVVTPFSQLAGLSLTGCHIDDTDAFTGLIKSLPGLTHFDLQDCTYFVDDALNKIAKVLTAHPSQLKVLKLGIQRKEYALQEITISSLLNKHTSLQELDLRGHPFSEADARLLAKHSHELTSLALSSPTLTENTINTIASGCKKLTRLHLGGENISFADIVQATTSMPGLEELTVEASCMSNLSSLSQSAAFLSTGTLPFKAPKRLHLGLNKDALTKEHLQLLIALCEKHPATSLTLDGVTPPWLVKMHSALASKRTKTPSSSLNFSDYDGLSDQAVNMVIAALAPVKEVNFSNCSISKTTLTALATHHAASLTSLNLKESRGVPLADAKDPVKALSYVNFADVKDLIAQCKQLQTISVDSHIKEIDDSLLYTIIVHNQHVTTLDLGDTRITDEALIALYKARPDIQVHHAVRTKEALLTLKQKATEHTTTASPKTNNNTPHTLSPSSTVIEWDGSAESMAKAATAITKNHTLHLRFRQNSLSIQALISIIPTAWHSHVTACTFEGITFNAPTSEARHDNIPDAKKHSLPNLKELKFSRCHINDANGVAQWIFFSKIASLDFDSCVFVIESALHTIIENAASALQTLRLHQNRGSSLREEELVSLLNKIKNLQALHLFKQDFSYDAADALAKHTHLKALSLSTYMLTKEVLEIITTSCIHLTYLHLGGSQIGKGIEHVATMLTELEELAIEEKCFDVCKEFLLSQDPQLFRKLRKLDLAFPDSITLDEKMELFLALYQKYPNLTLTIKGAPILPELHYQLIFAMSSFEGMKEVFLKRDFPLNSSLITHILPKLTHVKSLYLSGNSELNDVHLKTITNSDLALKQTLRHLDMSYCANIHDQHIGACIKELPSLTDLNVAGCNAGISTFEALAEKHTSSLVTLNIQDCDMGIWSPEAKEAVEQSIKDFITHCQALEKLSIGSSFNRKIDVEKVMKHLTATKNARLTDLDIGVSSVSDKTLIAFYQAFPEIRLVASSRTPEQLITLRRKAQHSVPLAQTGVIPSYAQNIINEALGIMAGNIEPKLLCCIADTLQQAFMASPHRQEGMPPPKALCDKWTESLKRCIAPQLRKTHAHEQILHQKSKCMQEFDNALTKDLIDYTRDLTRKPLAPTPMSHTQRSQQASNCNEMKY